MSFDFVSFDRRTIPATTQPMATLQQKGTLGLNLAAMQALNSPEAVELLYDRKARAIGLRPIDIKEPKAYPIRRQQSSNSYIVSLTRLCTYYGIDTTTARRYAPTLVDDVLVIELEKSLGEATGPRQGHKHANNEKPALPL